MITANRRRQFGNSVDDRIKIIHPQWWHIKFHAATNNATVLNLNNNVTFSVQEVVDAPSDGTVSVSGYNIVASKAGDYDIYFTMSVSGNCSVNYGWNCPYYTRLPSPYFNNDKFRALYSFGPGGGTQTVELSIYLINSYPPYGPSNTALGALADNPKCHFYIQKGYLENYITSKNTKWQSLYNAGRLTEVNYNIIED